MAACGGDDVLEEPLDIGTSPLQLSLGGGDIGRYHRGAVVGNWCLCAGVLLVGCLLAVPEFLRRSRDGASRGAHTSSRAWKSAAETGMPAALAMPVFGLLLPSTTTASVSLLWSAQPGDVALAVASLMLVAALTAWLARLLCMRAASFRARASRVRRGHERGAAAAVARALVGRRWGWRDVKGARGFCGVYGALFDAMRASVHWWPAVELVVGVVTAAVSGLLVTEQAACDSLTGVLGATGMLLVLLTLWLQTYDALLDLSQSVLANGLTVVAAIVALSTDSETAADGVLWTQTILSLASLLLSVVCVIQAAVDGIAPSNRLFLWVWLRLRSASPTTTTNDKLSSSIFLSDEDEHALECVKSSRRRGQSRRTATLHLFTRSPSSPETMHNLELLLARICQQQAQRFGRRHTKPFQPYIIDIQ